MASKTRTATTEVPTTISEITASLVAWSAQSVEVNAYGGGSAHSEPYIVVRVGTTLTYCYDRHALGSYATAWMEGEETARALRLPRRLPPPTWLAERGQYVAVSAVVSGRQRCG